MLKAQNLREIGAKAKDLPLKPKIFDMGTAQKTPGIRNCRDFHQKTLQREQKKEKRRKLRQPRRRI